MIADLSALFISLSRFIAGVGKIAGHSPENERPRQQRSGNAENDHFFCRSKQQGSSPIEILTGSAVGIPACTAVSAGRSSTLKTAPYT